MRATLKVEDQARLLARTLDNMALEPDGTATACKAVWSGFDSGTVRSMMGRLLEVQRIEETCEPCVGLERLLAIAGMSGALQDGEFET